MAGNVAQAAVDAACQLWGVPEAIGRPLVHKYRSIFHHGGNLANQVDCDAYLGEHLNIWMWRVGTVCPQWNHQCLPGQADANVAVAVGRRGQESDVEALAQAPPRTENSKGSDK